MVVVPGGGEDGAVARVAASALRLPGWLPEG